MDLLEYSHSPVFWVPLSRLDFWLMKDPLLLLAPECAEIDVVYLPCLATIEFPLFFFPAPRPSQHHAVFSRFIPPSLFHLPNVPVREMSSICLVDEASSPFLWFFFPCKIPCFLQRRHLYSHQFAIQLPPLIQRMISPCFLPSAWAFPVLSHPASELAFDPLPDRLFAALPSGYRPLDSVATSPPVSPPCGLSRPVLFPLPPLADAPPCLASLPLFCGLIYAHVIPDFLRQKPLSHLRTRPFLTMISSARSRLYQHFPEARRVV